MPVIDVHTHMLSDAWLEAIRVHGDPYYIDRTPAGHEAVFVEGAPFLRFTEPMFDYARRIRDMDEAGVDLAVVSLTGPSVYWGTPEISARVAAAVNDEMAAAQGEHPDRIRYFATLPWEHAELAVAELARACANGAIGVMVLANINGASLTDARFQPIWDAIDARGLPVLVHPSSPPGLAQLDIKGANLMGTVAFTFDTTLAIARMTTTGFLERYQRLHLIAAHGGGTLPYIVSRMDWWYERQADYRQLPHRPSDYLRQVYYDAVLYDPIAIRFLMDTMGSSQVLFGTDYPHLVGDMRGCRERVESLGGNASQRITGTNAERLFGL